MPSSYLNKIIYWFIFVCVLSSLGSPFMGSSLSNFVTKQLEWFVIFFLVLEVFTEKKHFKILFIVFLVTSCSTALDALWQFHFSGKDIFLGRVIDLGSRATAGFKTPNSLGGYLEIVIPFFSVLFMKSHFIKLDSKVKGFLLGLLFWSIVITFSRGAWLGTAVGLGSVIFLLRSPTFINKKTGFILLSIAYILLIVFIFFILSNNAELADRSSKWRLMFWNNCLEMIWARPIFGHGINTFMKVTPYYNPLFIYHPSYAHNSYLQIWVETGTAGLACFLIMLGMPFVKALKIIRSKLNTDLKVIHLGWTGGLLAFVVHSFLDNHFYSLQLSIYFWFSLGILVALQRLILTQK